MPATVIYTHDLDLNNTARVRNLPAPVDDGDATPKSYVDNLVNNSAGVPDATETTAGKIRIATQAETDAGTIDNAAVTPLKLRNAAWSARRFSATFGDTTNTLYDITHNLNTTDVIVAVRRASDGAMVSVAWRALNSNTVRVELLTAPGNNALRITVLA